MTPDQTTSENEDISSWLDASDRSPAGLIMRVVLLIFGATACLLLPTLGQGRFVICMVLLFYVPLTWWVELKLKPPLVDIVLAVGQAILGLIIALVLPGLFVASLIFVLTAAVVTSPSLGMRRRFWLIPLFLAFGPIGTYHNVEGWHFLVTFAILGFLSTSEFVSWMILCQEVVELRLSLMAYGANGVLWEFDVTSVEFNKAGGATQELLEVSCRGFLDLLNDSHNAVRFAIDASLGTAPRKVIVLKSPSGRRRWVRLSAVSRTRADGTMVVHGMAFDVSELERARELLRGKAEQDALTGLPNREGLERFIDESQAENTPTQGGLAIMLLDLDRFKEINDTFGHPVGDQVIRILAHRISRWTAEDVCVARLGGDEFALAVVAGRGEVGGRAVSIATRIQAHAAEIISVGSLNLATSISIGIASGANDDWIELLRRADVAMYKAKRSSKVAVQVYCAEIGPDIKVNANAVTDLTSRN